MSHKNCPMMRKYVSEFMGGGGGGQLRGPPGESILCILLRETGHVPSQVCVKWCLN